MDSGHPWALNMEVLSPDKSLVQAAHPYLQGKAIRERIFSMARLGASIKVCLQILQELLVLQSLQ